MAILIGLLAVAILVLANAFFVAAEFAVVAIRPTRLREWENEGRLNISGALSAAGQADRVIAASQLGITLASLGLGWIGEPALERPLAPLFEVLPPSLASLAGFGLAALLAFAMITSLHVIVGELAPKALALQYPEKTLLWVSRGILAFELLFRPIIWALNQAGFLVLRLFRLPPPPEHARVHSAEELKMLIAESEDAGQLEQHEEDMLHKVFEFGDRDIREVMIPRTDVIGLPAESTIRDLLVVFSEHPHARFPIYEESLDRVVGIVAIKDVMRSLANGSQAFQTPLRELAREPVFVPEAGQVASLFEYLRQRGTQMAIAVDEYGGMAGLVTIEEMVEEIVGRIGDELAGAEPPVEEIDERTFQIDGQMRIDELNRELGLSLPEAEDYETVAGFLLDLIGRMPEEGEEILWGDVRFEIVQMRGPRIEEVKVVLKDHRRQPATTEPPLLEPAED